MDTFPFDRISEEKHIDGNNMFSLGYESSAKLPDDHTLSSAKINNFIWAGQINVLYQQPIKDYIADHFNVNLDNYKFMVRSFEYGCNSAKEFILIDNNNLQLSYNIEQIKEIVIASGGSVIIPFTRLLKEDLKLYAKNGLCYGFHEDQHLHIQLKE